MASEDLNKIWDKIRKISALKQSATEIGEEGEAQAAAAAITRLLLKYDLSLDDIPDEEKAKNKIVLRDIDFKVSYDNLQWFSFLIGTVCDANSCQHMTGKKISEKNKIVKVHKVVGREKNVEIVLYLVSFLSNHFLSAARKKRKISSYSSVQLFMKSFLLGCVYGLSTKFAQEKESFAKSDVTALALRTSQEIDKFFEEQNFRITDSRKSTIRQLDPDSFSGGVEVGKNTEISQGLDSGGIKETNFLE